MSDNAKRILFKVGYYLVTLACLVVSVFALRYAYHYLWGVPLMLWIALYCLIALYVALVLIFIKRNIRRGIYVFAAHSLLLQVVPLVAAILTFSLVPQSVSYEPIEGSARVYERTFNDLQPKQKAAALANGLAPFKSRAEIEARYKELRRKDKLVHIETNSKYVVRELTHSSPYVVPKVEELLNDIADSFQEKTQSNAKFVVTSVLRTEEDIKKLSKSNVNASAASCHCNATTIDISYVRFEADKHRPRNNYELRLALAQTLHELREAGRCYVKIERKQYCYHITVR